MLRTEQWQRTSALLGLLIVLATPALAAAQTIPVPAPVQIPEQQPVADASQDLTSAAWQWLRSEYGDDSIVEVADPSRYTISFRPDGTLAIRADCNQAGGTYRQQGSTLALQLGPSTLIACPADSQADVFTRDLMAVATYVFSGDNLVLNMRLDTGNMVFEHLPEMSLTDTTWRVQSVNNGRGGVVSVLPTTSLSLRFTPDGAVSGNAGCNSLRGAYVLEGDGLSFGPLATTRMACAEPVLTQEQAFLAALAATTQMSRAGSRLAFLDSTGATQVVLTPAT